MISCSQKDTHQNLIKSESNSLGMLSIIYHYWIHWKWGWEPENALLMACVQVTIKPSHHILPAFHRMSVSVEPRPWLSVCWWKSLFLTSSNTAGRCRARALGRDRKAREEEMAWKLWLPSYTLSHATELMVWNHLSCLEERKYMPGYFVKTRGILRPSQILPANSTFKSWECLRSETDRTKHLLQHFSLVTKVQNTV